MKNQFDIISDLEYRKKYCNKYLNDTDKEIKEYILSVSFVSDIEKLRKGIDIIDVPYATFIPKLNGKYRFVAHYDEHSKALISIIARFLYEKYDNLFSPSLYSFRVGNSVQDIIEKIRGIQNINQLFYYRTDASDFDRNIDREKLKEIIQTIISDEEMRNFLSNFVDRKTYFYKGEMFENAPAVMTGSTLSQFFENIYLMEFDSLIESRSELYFRYFDDILIYGSEEQIRKCREFSDTYLTRNMKLKINATKSSCNYAEIPFEYLGYKICGNKIDFTDSYIRSVRKAVLYKTNSLLKIKRKLNLSDETILRLAIKQIRLFDAGIEKMFPIISENNGLKEIDHCVQNALRIIGSGHTSNRRYKITYNKLKELGYEPFLSQYYKWRKRH